jgi:acyl-CoA thioesterase
MEPKLHGELIRRSQSEPYALLLRLTVVEVRSGFAKVLMTVHPDLVNLFGAIHGGAVFSAIDEAFQLASNSHGVLAVALSVTITYIAVPEPETELEATAEEIHRTRRTASYKCEVRERHEGKLIATAQALAYRTGKEIASP